MHARHDKHPFEKLPVTVAKLIYVIIEVSITKKAVHSVLFVVVASIANKYCGGGADDKLQIELASLEPPDWD